MKFIISLLLCIHFSLYGANFDHLNYSYHASLWKIYPEFRSEKYCNKHFQFN